MSTEDIRHTFSQIVMDLDFHQSIISRSKHRFRKYPFRTTKYILINLYWKVRIYFGHGPLIRARTFWGDPMTVMFPTYRSIYQFGILDGWELIVQKMIIEHLPAGGTFIDIGANIGFYTLLASSLVGEKGEIHSFEPTPSTFVLLEENTKGKQNVSLNQIALGTEEGVAVLADFGLLESGLNSIRILEHTGMTAKKIMVQTTTLDSYCQKNNITPTMIKADVEGMEYEVLKGAVNILQIAHPILILEVGAYEKYAPLFNLLKENGYNAYSSNTTLDLVPYIEGSVHGRMNMVFIHESKNENIVEVKIRSPLAMMAEAGATMT